MPHAKDSDTVVAVDFIDNDVRVQGNQFASSLNPAGSTTTREHTEAFTGKQKLPRDASSSNRIFGFDVTKN